MLVNLDFAQPKAFSSVATLQFGLRQRGNVRGLTFTLEFVLGGRKTRAMCFIDVRLALSARFVRALSGFHFRSESALFSPQCAHW